MEDVALHEIFRALSDPTRLVIFQMLRNCPEELRIDENGDIFRASSVTQVCCQVQVAQPTVSHHLKELRQAGLIEMHRRGRHVLCSVAPRALERIRAFAEAPPCCERPRPSSTSAD